MSSGFANSPNGTRASISDVDILRDPLGAERLGNGHEPMIHVPTKHDLHRGLPVFRSKPDDDRVREGILQGARSNGVTNAATQWGPRFGNDAVRLDCRPN